jgi:eukaryotic-like serine/threonine-protein kinase
VDGPSPEAFGRAYAIFDAALDLPLQQRARHIARECADDAELSAAVQRLLDAHEHAPDFLVQPAVELAAPLLVAMTAATRGTAAESDVATRQVGAYRLVRVLGHGGMGTVYLAPFTDRLFRSGAGSQPDGFRHPQVRSIACAS